MNREIEYEESSGNGFAGPGAPDADELLLLKTELARQIRVAIAARKLTQGEAARLLGTRQPEVSQLARGGAGFSLERLIRYLTALGHNVEIVVHERSESRGSATVTIAA